MRTALRNATAVAVVVAVVGATSPAEARRPVDPDPHWLVPTLHAGAVVLALRITASLMWPSTFDAAQVGRNASTFADGWTSAPRWDDDAAAFEWDGDGWPINAIGHGIMGSEFYLRYRQAHHPIWVAAVMTIAWTLLWEYGVEAWHKRPSGIDLIWTPVGGTLIGEGRYQLMRAVARLPPGAGRTALRYLLDPLGQLERDLLGLHF